MPNTLAYVILPVTPVLTPSTRHFGHIHSGLLPHCHDSCCDAKNNAVFICSIVSLVSFLRSKLHPIFTCVGFLSRSSVFVNLFECFQMSAMKCHAYYKMRYRAAVHSFSVACLQVFVSEWWREGCMQMILSTCSKLLQTHALEHKCCGIHYLEIQWFIGWIECSPAGWASLHSYAFSSANPLTTTPSSCNLRNSSVNLQRAFSSSWGPLRTLN